MSTLSGQTSLSPNALVRPAASGLQSTLRVELWLYAQGSPQVQMENVICAPFIYIIKIDFARCKVVITGNRTRNQQSDDVRLPLSKGASWRGVG